MFKTGDQVQLRGKSTHKGLVADVTANAHGNVYLVKWYRGMEPRLKDARPRQTWEAETAIEMQRVR